MDVVELFAGVGGLRCGLERASADFNTIWANQWEPPGTPSRQFAYKCYVKNFGNNPNYVNEDISLAKSDVPKKFDLLVGGFPCQDYSVASTNAKGIEGKKGVLWWHIRDIIESRRPKYILLENVDRLLKSPTTQRGRDFGIILRCLADLGYSAEWRVINAADYGEVQRRRRVFIFACRKDLSYFNSLTTSEPEEIVLKTGFFSVPFPVSSTLIKERTASFSIGSDRYANLKTVSDSFAHSFWNCGYMIPYDSGVAKVYTRECKPHYKGHQIMLGDIIIPGSGENHSEEEHMDKWKIMKGSKRIERTSKQGHKYLYSEGAISCPDPLDKPGRTMLTSEGTRNRSSHLIKDPMTGTMRTLTPVECERMNGFPDGWTEDLTDRQRYFTMGNALVVPLITKMGKRLMEIDSHE